MNPLKVGKIGFANCTPIFRALEEVGPLEGVEFVSGVPTSLNSMLRGGEIDISPSSSVEYLERPDLYGFLPDLSISSIGAVASVLLFTNCPLEELGGKQLSLSPASATSVILLRILLEGYKGVKAGYLAAPHNADGVLLIGDEALREKKKANGWKYVYDLGSLWHEATGEPFVFALWIARREKFAQEPQRMKELYRKLVAARHLAYRSYERYAVDADESKWMGKEGLVDYWQTISYDLTDWHLSGLKTFAKEAAKLGLISPLKEIAPLIVEG